MRPSPRLALCTLHAELPASEERAKLCEPVEQSVAGQLGGNCIESCLLPVQGSVRLVAGNTGFGIYKEWLPEDHLIDVKQVPELRRLSLSKVLLPIPHQSLLSNPEFHLLQLLSLAKQPDQIAHVAMARGACWMVVLQPEAGLRAAAPLPERCAHGCLTKFAIISVSP